MMYALMLMLYMTIVMVVASVICISTGGYFACLVAACLIFGAMVNLLAMGVKLAVISSEREKREEQAEKVKNWVP